MPARGGGGLMMNGLSSNSDDFDDDDEEDSALALLGLIPSIDANGTPPYRTPDSAPRSSSLRRHGFGGTASVSALESESESESKSELDIV